MDRLTDHERGYKIMGGWIEIDGLMDDWFKFYVTFEQFFIYIKRQALCNIWPHFLNLHRSGDGGRDKDEGDGVGIPKSSSKPENSLSWLIQIGQG